VGETANFRETLREGRATLGTFLLIPRVEIVELLAAAGFDAVIIDLEHGSTDLGDIPALVAAAHGANVFAAARVGGNSATEIGRVLDTGVDGVLVPHLSSAVEAASLVAAGRYPPVGSRSLNPYSKGNGYGFAGQPCEDANRRTALVAMLEGIDALSNLEEICELEEIDAVFVGPMDLSGSLGLPDEPEHPKVVGAVRDVIGRALLLGTAAGTYAPTAEAASRWFTAGAAFVALSADVAMAGAGFAAACSAVLPAEPGVPAT
jgi:4-hydroxy-2-oxoheptanedioate aldolase